MEDVTQDADVATERCPHSKDAQLADLIVQKHSATKRIKSLECEVAGLRSQLQQSSSEGLYPPSTLNSAGLVKEAAELKSTPLADMSMWCEELIHTVDHLQRSLIQLEVDSKTQVITLTDRVNQLCEENEKLLRENDSLKARVGDDVLRQRQTNRIEVAFERARIAARVRAAGQKRLEAVEATLMEAHDDMYYVRRWDARHLPQRDVSFVFHYISKVVFPLSDVEGFIMQVCQQFLLHSCNCYRGYRVGCFESMEIFAFQSPRDALDFSKECHEQLVRLAWSSRIESVPAFSTIIEDNTILYKGPRIHTCIFTCSPESHVDPVSGNYAFFGPAIMEAVRAALQQAPLGEIAVNERWIQLLCLQSRLLEDREATSEGSLSELRECLGSKWSVVGLPGAYHITASILPSQLQGRRGVQPTALHPSCKYPSLDLKDTASAVINIVKAMKGMLADTVENREEGSRRSAGGGVVTVPQAPRRVDVLPDAMEKLTTQSPAQARSFECSSSAAQLLELFSLQEEKKSIVALYHKTQLTCEAFERDIMESEDRFEISKHKGLDASETAYVCTIDTGDESIWRRLLMKSISDEHFESVRNKIRQHIHNAAKMRFGFLMNGNYSDVFTYAFREVEQVLAFVSETYIEVNRTGTKYAHMSIGKGRDIFLFRAGVASGPMSTIYRSLDNGVLKCTGPVIRLSGTLCDLAGPGEILAMEDIIRCFHSKNENLLDTQYNIVKQGCQFLGSSDAPAAVHSILPKPFAYRRQQLRDHVRSPLLDGNLFLPSRSVMVALKPRRDELPRQGVVEMMEQQLQRMALGEEARMQAEDDYERRWELGAMSAPLLRNPWPLLCQPQAEEQSDLNAIHRSLVRLKTMEEVEVEQMYARKPAKAISFLYCNMFGASAIAKACPSCLLQRVLANYNYFVQNAVRAFSGYIAKTNSTTAYLVIFEEPVSALEAARQIQLDMVQSAWPEELKTLEPTLYVKDPKTHTVLFNGPRPQISVHLSDKYQWRTLASPIAAGSAGRKSEVRGTASSVDDNANNIAAATPSVIHVSGVGVDETLLLGLHAKGGEMRLSSPLLEAVGRDPRGKLLLEQLVCKVVVAPSVIRPSEETSGDVELAPSAALATSKKLEPEIVSKAAKTHVFSEECVAAVPRRFENRLSLMVPSAGRSLASSTLTESAFSVASAAVPESNKTSGSSSSAVSALRGAETNKPSSAVPEDGQPLLAVLAGDESTGRASAALPKAEPLLPTLLAQHAWYVDPKGSSNPLPAAWRPNWGADTQVPESSLNDLGLLVETRQIQGILLEVSKMFPSPQQQSQALSLAMSAPCTENNGEQPEEGAAVSTPPTNIGSASAAGKRKAVDARLTSKAPVPSASVPPDRVAARITTTHQFFNFMEFSKYLITVLVNALEIGADQRAPPPLPLPPVNRPLGPSARAISSGGYGGRLLMPGGGGVSGNISPKFPRDASGDRPQGGLSALTERSSAGDFRELNGTLLPGISGANARPLGKSLTSASSSLASVSGSKEAESQSRTTADSFGGGFKVNTDHSFQCALDYLDDACRALTQLSGTELGRLMAIPPAPPSAKPKGFPVPSSATRRH